MKRKIDNRERLLRELVEYAEQSGTFNPHFQCKEMMDRLNLTECEFNILQRQLGDKYCRSVDTHQGDNRYEICVNECLALLDEIEYKKTQEKRHNQLVRMALEVAILGAVIGVALTLLFLKK